MSKVHKALKRAEQERASALSIGNVDEGDGPSSKPSIVTRFETIGGPSVPSGLRATDQGSPAPVRQKQASTISPDGISEQRLRFEELVKQCTKTPWKVDRKVVLFSESNHGVSGAEQFRTLRSRLYQQREKVVLKKVLITSAVHGEGKTFVATNLAQAIACERDRPVLLIDGDLRSPKLHLPLGAPLTAGLSEYLSDQAEENTIVQHGQEGNLCFIAAGGARDNPSELLCNGRFEKLLDRLAPCFEWIIIDSPPSLPVADAHMIARMCQGVVLVVRARSTPFVAVEKVQQEFRGRNIVGVVLNAVETADALPYGSYSVAGPKNGHASV